MQQGMRRATFMQQVRIHRSPSRGQRRPDWSKDTVANLHQVACRAEMAAEGVGVVVGVRVAGVGVGVLVVAGVVAAS